MSERSLMSSTGGASLTYQTKLQHSAQYQTVQNDTEGKHRGTKAKPTYLRSVRYARLLVQPNPSAATLIGILYKEAD